MTDELIARTKEDNLDPRVACVLLLDTSESMSGAPIDGLNAGFRRFCDEIKQDPLAKKRTEVSVITFGGTARVEIPFTEGRDLQPRTFTPAGSTPMGAALNMAMDEIEAQKRAYKSRGLEYFRPWLFVLTDGAPTDAEFPASAARVKSAEGGKGVTVFGVGVGDQADLTKLYDISNRAPVMLKGYSFTEMFQWLSASMGIVSSSQPGSSDAEIADNEAHEQVPLPPPSGWATW